MLPTALAVTLVSQRGLGNYFLGNFINFSNVLGIFSKNVFEKSCRDWSGLTTNRLVLFVDVRFQCFPHILERLI